MAIRARSGDRTLLSVFRETGMILGELLKEKQKADGFTEYALGGGVSCEWDLMREGYDEVCSIPYRIISDPMFCAVKGMLNALALGKERIYLTN